jgi:hypothetical protein
MPRLASVGQLLSVAGSLLGHAAEQLDGDATSPTHDLSETLRAARRELLKIEQRIWKLQPESWSLHALRCDGPAQRRLIEHLDQALAGEDAHDLERACATWRAFLAQPRPHLHYGFAELELCRLEGAIRDALPDAPLDAAEQARVDALSPAQIAEIDHALLAAADRRWRKVAFVVGTVLVTRADLDGGVPDLYYAQRITRLVERGELESQGDLMRMRWSEVRLPRG